MKNVREGNVGSNISVLEKAAANLKALYVSGTTRDAIDSRELPLVAKYREDKTPQEVTPEAVTNETPLVNPNYSSNPFVAGASSVAGFDVTQEPPVIKPFEQSMPEVNAPQNPVSPSVDIPDVVPPTIQTGIETNGVDSILNAINETISAKEEEHQEQVVPPVYEDVKPYEEPVASESVQPTEPVEQPVSQSDLDPYTEIAKMAEEIRVKYTETLQRIREDLIADMAGLEEKIEVARAKINNGLSSNDIDRIRQVLDEQLNALNQGNTNVR